MESPAFSIADASTRELANWDAHVRTSLNGTLFHTQAFLGYHGRRFADTQRNLVVRKGEFAFAQISLTIADVDGRRVARSPFGGSYGGFVFQRLPSYSEGKAIVSAFVAYLRDQGVDLARLTPSIACCAGESLDTFYFNLLEAGFRSINRDISSVVRLRQSEPILARIAGSARNHAAKARKQGIRIVVGAPLADFWPILAATQAKLGTQPTHTQEELATLLERVPDAIVLDVAYHETTPIAGMARFRLTAAVDSSFYLCQLPEFQRLQSLTLLIADALQRDEEAQCDWFDFGTSTAQMQARENLFSFKESFGKTGMFRETFEWNG